MTEVGMAVGTLGYMAPEQMKGQPVDHRADIFAFGAVLHEMMAGAPAFRRDSRIGPSMPSSSRIRRRCPTPWRRRFVGSSRRCLEKDPDERFQSARDLAFALNALSDTIAGRGEPRGGPAVGRLRIDWRIAALAVVLAAARRGGHRVAPALERRVATSHDEALLVSAQDSEH